MLLSSIAVFRKGDLNRMKAIGKSVHGIVGASQWVFESLRPEKLKINQLRKPHIVRLFCYYNNPTTNL